MRRHQLIRQHLEHLRLQQNCSPYRVRCTGADLHLFYTYLEDEADAADFDFSLAVRHADGEIIEAFLQHLKDAPLGDTDRLRIMHALRMFFNWMERQGFITESPFAQLSS